MTDILFTANGASATVLVSGELTSGMVGLPVRFSFDSDWDGLNIVAVFDGGGNRISVPLLTDMEAVLPWEVIAKANTRLRIGAKGRKSDGSVVIPTVWANADYIKEGAVATDEEGNPPTPGIYDQIMAAIEAGKLKGKDGFSPIVDVSDIEGGHRITITDASGAKIFDVMDGVGGEGGSVSWDDIIDKPFGEEVVYYAWDKDTEYETSVDAPLNEIATKLVKLSNDAPDSSFFLGKTLSVRAINNGEDTKINTTITEDLFLQIQDEIYAVSDSAIVVTADSVTDGGFTLTRGVWAVSGYLETSPIQFLWWKIFAPLKQIDESLIPDTIARADGVVRTVNGIAPDENGNVEVEGGAGGGLTEAQITALDNMFRVCAFVKDDVSAEYNAFKTAFGLSGSGGDSGETEKTLTSISATYNGGDVAVGTALADLTGIVVTAHYSDGTSETVTGYTLSGTIAEGSNTVTVTYQGKTATFTVTGVAESGVSNETTWSDGVPYEYRAVYNSYVETGGTITAYNGWNRTPYMYCEGATRLRIVVDKASSMFAPSGGYNAFYDSEKNFIQNFSFADIDGNTVGAYKDIEIPANAAYFILSGKSGVIGCLDETREDNILKDYYAGFVPYA